MARGLRSMENQKVVMEEINVLAVDDSVEDLLVLETLLADAPIRLHCVTSGRAALALTREVDFAMVLLDVRMPGMDGFETAKSIRSHEKSKCTPIIFINTAGEAQQHQFKGYEAGAVDYLVKPLDPEILNNKVRIFLEFYRQKFTLRNSLEALKQVNRQLVEDQKKRIEEARLRLLFQLAGATAHELNQPLTAFTANISAMRATLQEPVDVTQGMKILDDIETGGQRIVEVIQKMQAIQQDRIRRQDRAVAQDCTCQGIRVLYVEDDELIFRATQIMIKDKRFMLDHAPTIRDGIEKIGETQYQLVLLDYHLPDGNGLDFMEAIASAGIDLPVVILTATNDEILATKMIQRGAYEYVTKGSVKGEALTRVLNRALEKAALKQDLLAVQQRMAGLAYIDELTGVFNRRYVLKELQREIMSFDPQQDELSLCIIDLDHFKAVNDTHGHLAGDRVLAETARLLRSTFRSRDILGRYGGEEFLVIFPNTSVQKARITCERCRRLMEEHPFMYDCHPIRQTISIGLAGHQGQMSSAALIERADKALYSAKTAGRNMVMVDQTG